MKKFKLSMEGMKDMLTRDQMKRVVGGYGETVFHTCYVGSKLVNCYIPDVIACVNGCIAVANADNTYCGGCA